MLTEEEKKAKEEEEVKSAEVKKNEPSAQNLKGEYDRKIEQERKRNEEMTVNNEALKTEIEEMKEKVETMSAKDLEEELDERGWSKEDVELIMKEVDKRTGKVKEEILSEIKQEKDNKIIRTDLLSKHELFANLPKEQKDEVNSLLDTYPSASWANPRGIDMAVNEIIVSHMGSGKEETGKVPPPAEPDSDTSVESDVEGVSQEEVKDTKERYKDKISAKKAAEVVKAEKNLKKTMFPTE